MITYFISGFEVIATVFDGFILGYLNLPKCMIFMTRSWLLFLYFSPRNSLIVSIIFIK